MTEKVRAVPSRPTKLPKRRVICDDFEVVINGKRFWPHASEELVVGQGSIGDVVISIGLGGLGNPSEMTPQEAREAKETLETMLDRAVEAISSWTWTDNDGVKYPSPPTVEDLRRLSPEELAYINEKVIGGDSEDAAKNGSSPSTSRSTRRRGPRRRRSG